MNDALEITVAKEIVINFSKMKVDETIEVKFDDVTLEFWKLHHNSDAIRVKIIE